MHAEGDVEIRAERHAEALRSRRFSSMLFVFFALSGNLFEIAIFWALPRYAREENAIFLLFRASRGGQIGHFRVFRASRGDFTLGAAGAVANISGTSGADRLL